MDADGVRVDEDKLKGMKELGDVHPGKSRSNTLTLKAGKYLLFCNEAGHFKAGMYTTPQSRRSRRIDRALRRAPIERIGDRRRYQRRAAASSISISVGPEARCACRNCSCRWGRLSASHGAAAEAARDGQEIRRVDVDADLRDAALGHVFLDLAIAAVVPDEDGHREFQLDRRRQLTDGELQAAVADQRDHRPLRWASLAPSAGRRGIAEACRSRCWSWKKERGCSGW